MNKHGGNHAELEGISTVPKQQKFLNSLVSLPCNMGQINRFQEKPEIYM